MAEAPAVALPRTRSRRPHYAWVVLACTMAVATVASGIRLSFGVFIDPLVEQYGWSRGEISVAYALVFLSAAPLTLVAGWLADTYGPRRIILAGAFLFTFGMILTGTATQLWQFYVYYGVLLGGLGTTLFTMLLPVVLTRWFQARMGLAVGLLWASVGIGPVILPLVLRGVIGAVGWQQAFLVVGIPTGLIILLSGIFLRNKPQDMGLTPYGQAASEPQERVAEDRAPAVTFATVRTNRFFWFLVLVHFMGCVGHSILLAHTVSMATIAGVPSLVAAGVLSVISAASIISRFTMSLMTEKKGGRWTLTLAFLLQTTPVLMLLWAHDTWSFYLFAALFGLGYGGEMVGFPIINRHYYGERAPLNSIYAYEIAGAMLGMAVGGWLGGALFDLSGSYTWSIIAALAFGYAGLVPILLLPVHRPGRLVVAPAPAGGAR
ncbi:MAG: MFS transporter [Chloroflexi bacterium]|nr:MFS transporter [Chloroflexota bacterium]